MMNRTNVAKISNVAKTSNVARASNVLRGWLVAVAVVACGCDPDWPGPSETVTVSGQVSLDDKPLADARVIFVPIMPLDVPLGELRPIAYGQTDDRGRYSLVQADGTVGAVTGQHTIFVSKPLTAETLAAENNSGVTDAVPDFYRRDGYLKRHVMPLPGSHEIDLHLYSIDPLLR